MTDHLTLLTKLKVKKIYWIDDENAKTEDLNINQLINSLAEQLTACDVESIIDGGLKVLKDVATTECRTAAKDIKAAWKSRDDADQTDKIYNCLESCIAEFPANKDPKEVVLGMLSALPQPFSQTEKQALASAFDGTGPWEWKPISFTQWATTHAEILSDHNAPDNTALLIVDLQNDRESNPIKGEDVLQHWATWVTSSCEVNRIFAVAFTSKYKQSDELKEGRNFTDKLFSAKPRSQLPVLVLSKARLQQDGVGESDTSKAAHNALKKALGRLRACLLHWELADNVQKLFADSVEEAFRTLQELSIEELLMAVSGSYTNKEGASDVDTLVRMAAIAQRAALLTSIASNSNVADILLELRGLTEIFEEFRGKELAATSGIARLRASEVHDPGSVVNGLMSPLATGDVFEIIRHGCAEYYMLASNTCDLTLRGNTGRRKLESGVMLKMAEKAAEKAADEASKAVPAFPAGSPLAGKVWAVEYHSIVVVPLDILDLCWTNKNGACGWRKADGIPDHLAPSQHRRFVAMLNNFNDQQKLKLLKERLHGVQYTCEPSENDVAILSGINFDVRRVGRITQDYAVAINDGFARNLTRPSLDHDISAG